MYKMTGLDGREFSKERPETPTSYTINYAENIRKIVRVNDYSPLEDKWERRGLSAVKQPNGFFLNPLGGGSIPCRVFKVKGIDKIGDGKYICRYKALKILEEIKDLDKLFGWKYNEAINPIDPFKIKAPKNLKKVSNDSLQFFNQIISDLLTLDFSNSINRTLGKSYGMLLYSMQNRFYDLIWNYIKDSSINFSVLSYIGSLFPNIKKWEHIKHKKGEYPFQFIAELWKQGLVISFDSIRWRLHKGPEGRIVKEFISNPTK